MDTRTQIIEAARRCFLARGYRGTSIADIRREADVTTGSIYHFFDSKAELALLVLKSAIWEWAQAVPRDEPFEVRLKTSIRAMVIWGRSNRQLSSLLDEIRTLSQTDADLACVKAWVDEQLTSAEGDYRAALERGEVRPLRWAVARSFFFGPFHDYIRLNAEELNIEEDAEIIAEQAWEAVRARP